MTRNLLRRTMRSMGYGAVHAPVRRDPHDPTPACEGHHCYSHNIDEPIGLRRPYQVCGECLHLYPTAGHLRRVYRAEKMRLLWHDARTRQATTPTVVIADAPAAQCPGPIAPVDPMAFGPFGPTPLWRIALEALTVPFTTARSVRFCPHCMHDL